MDGGTLEGTPETVINDLKCATNVQQIYVLEFTLDF